MSGEKMLVLDGLDLSIMKVLCWAMDNMIEADVVDKEDLGADFEQAYTRFKEKIEYRGFDPETGEPLSSGNQ